MKSIKCLILLGLLVASASARPGIIDSIVDTIAHPLSSSVAESSARSQSLGLGGSIGLGPFSIGGNLNSASSRAFSSASAVNSAGYRPEYVPVPGYRRIDGSRAAALAESEARAIDGGFVPFNAGGNFNSARAEAHSSASAVKDYDPVYVPEFGSVSQAHARVEAQAIAQNQRRYY